MKHIHSGRMAHPRTSQRSMNFAHPSVSNGLGGGTIDVKPGLHHARPCVKLSFSKPPSVSLSLSAVDNLVGFLREAEVDSSIDSSEVWALQNVVMRWKIEIVDDLLVVLEVNRSRRLEVERRGLPALIEALEASKARARALH